MPLTSGFSLVFSMKLMCNKRRIKQANDLGLDTFFQEISADAKERRYLTNVISQITNDPKVAAYRQQIFGEILRLPELRKTMLGLFDRLQFMKDFSTMHKTSEAG